MLEKNEAKKVLAWSDGKIFTVKAVTNRQNDGIYARNAGDFSKSSRRHLRHQKSSSLMVWAAVAFDSSKSLLIFIEAGVKVNGEVYVEMLDEKVLPSGKKTFGDRYIFTQDWVPDHTSRLTKKSCQEHFSGFGDKKIWPPITPDISPMDFPIWSILESNVSASPYSNVSDLKKALLSSWVKLNQEAVGRS
ncbi:uncharacterized protein LOC115225783 [Octopus sinensis]|uniref:Uncharacterized protein LOC115225783 n=1 Tax=Octopus sinensis TaxID=2607531 RepID=A0A6P7TL04_9MOLL|nr:uncharacterized protein LOC115225783 [Octopus sinensis]